MYVKLLYEENEIKYRPLRSAVIYDIFDLLYVSHMFVVDRHEQTFSFFSRRFLTGKFQNSSNFLMKRITREPQELENRRNVFRRKLLPLTRSIVW